jgi:putative YhbY family RNA-binding protein
MLLLYPVGPIDSMPLLSPAERRALKARAHHLQPVVMIGEAGLTPAVVKEINLNLDSHELIKIKVLGDDRQQRKNLNDEICNALDANPVQCIGKILVIFRPRPASEEKKTVSRRKPRKLPRRTKRSYQNQ